MTYEAKLQKSKEKGMDTINGQVTHTKKMMDEKVKWGVTMMEKKTHDIMQKTVTTLKAKIQNSEGAISTVVKNLRKKLEGMEVSTLEKCKNYENITTESCSKTLYQHKSNVLLEIQKCFQQCDMKIQEKLINVENNFKSYQSKVKDLVDTNLQEVLDTTHDYNKEIRSLAATCNKDSGGSLATDGKNVKLILQQLSDKHAQRIARITDDNDIKMKASMQEMYSKYEMYSDSMSQQKREINDIIVTFQSKQRLHQAQFKTMLESQTEEVNKSLLEVRHFQTRFFNRKT